MIKIITNKSVDERIFKQPFLFELGIRRSWHEIGSRFSNHTKKLIKNPPKTGRMYGMHQASAPGEAPANKTGRLMNSISYSIHSTHELEIGASARSNKGAPYPRFLEEGTKKMAPRPYLIKSADYMDNEIVQLLEKTVNETLRKRL